MQAEAKSLSIGDLVALSVRLDGLTAAQNPTILSSALKIAFTERELYDRYLSSLVVDADRAKALLEVFDKVRP